MNAMTPDERHVDLETKLGFLERTVESLNEVIVEQARSIDRLELKLTNLEGRFASQGDPGQASSDLQADKPPHY